MTHKYQSIHPLIISLDTNLLKPEYGNAFERQNEYAQHLGSYTIIVLNIASSDSDRYQPMHQGNLHVYPTNSKSKWHFMIDVLKHQALTQTQADYTVISTQDLYLTGLIGVLLKHKLKLPLNLQMHSDDLLSKHWLKHSFQNQLFKQLARFTLHQADSVRYLNQRQLHYLKSVSTKISQHAYKAPIYVDTNYFYKPVEPKKNITKLITVGRLSWEKNYQSLIQAIKLVSSKQPSIHLTIVGDGSEREKLQNQVSKFKLHKHVSMIGSAAPEKVKQQLNQTDAFIMSSYDEGWGMVINEAVAAGLPVIMPNTGCAGELIVNQQTGLVFEGRDTAAIVQSLNTALSHPNKMFQMAKQAQTKLQSSYTKEKLLTAWLDCLYETSQLKT